MESTVSSPWAVGGVCAGNFHTKGVFYGPHGYYSITKYQLVIISATKFKVISIMSNSNLLFLHLPRLTQDPRKLAAPTRRKSGYSPALPMRRACLRGAPQASS